MATTRPQDCSAKERMRAPAQRSADTSPLVSVVMPLFNNRDTVRRAVESALTQEGARVEMIVVDDGSTDGSVDVLVDIGDRITLLSQANAGPGAARSLAMSAATGEYIAFLDADDYWLPGFLRRTTEFMRMHPDCDAVSTAYYNLQEGKYYLKPRVLATSPDRLTTGVIDDFFATYATYWQTWTGTVVMRRSLIEKVGTMREDLGFAEDMEYWLRIATVGTWGFIAEPSAVYDRSSATSLTGLWVRENLLPTTDRWQRAILPLLTPAMQSSFEAFRSSWLRGLIAELLRSDRPRNARELNRLTYVVRPRRYRPFNKILNHSPLIIWWIYGRLIRLRDSLRRRRGAVRQPAAFAVGEEPWFAEENRSAAMADTDLTTYVSA